MKHPRAAGYAFGTVLLWASAFVLTKIALGYFTAAVLGSLRYLIASLFFLIVLRCKRVGLPDKSDLPRFLLSGFLGFTLYMVTFNTASHTLTSATGSVIIASAPVLTAIFANIFFRERIKPAGWIAIAVSCGGILVLTLWNGILCINRGILWMLGAAVYISSYNLLMRQSIRKYTALQSTAYSVFAGTLFLLPGLRSALPQLAAAPIPQYGLLLFMGVCPSAVAYLLWSKALASARQTSEVTNFMFVTPLIAALMGFLLIGERPNAATLVGGVLIVTGLLLFQRTNTTTEGKAS